MPLTTFPIGLEVLNFLLIWTSAAEAPFGLWAKIILSVAFVAKFAFYFSGALCIDEGSPVLRRMMLVVSALINIGVVVYSIITGAWLLLINNAILLIMLIVWSFVAVFDITWTWGKKE